MVDWKNDGSNYGNVVGGFLGVRVSYNNGCGG